MNKRPEDIAPLPPSGGNRTRAGVLYAMAAYVTWGISPIYFKAMADVPAQEILGHRIVWSVVLLGVFLLATRRWSRALETLKDGRTHLILAATTVLIAVNWFLFIYAITTNHILQASLGYFINPLVSVVLGRLFLNERLSRLGKVSVLLAVIGVLIQLIQAGTVPFISLALAFSFGLYGLLRKIARVDSVVGLTVETALLAPMALFYLWFLHHGGAGHFWAGSLRLDGLLFAAGIITTVPLIWFTKSARRLNLTTVGFLQYIAPSLNFILAVFLYGEAFEFRDGLTFAFIWTALGIYSLDNVRRRHRR